MRRATSFALAAVTGCGVVVLSGPRSAAADKTSSAANSMQKAECQLPAGFQAKDLKQAPNIRSELATVTQDAVTRGDFGKIIDNLASEDRDRMNDYKNQDFKVLDGVVAQIHQDWRQKYGHDFDINGMKSIFAQGETIVQGTVSHAKLAAANFPIPAEMGEQARLASSSQKGKQAAADQAERKDLQQSKGVALVCLPAKGSLPSITASLIEEGNGTWRIAVPDTLTSQQIHQQLQNQLTYFGRDMKQWPANEADAYGMITHHVLMALYDVNAPQAEMHKK